MFSKNIWCCLAAAITLLSACTQDTADTSSDKQNTLSLQVTSPIVVDTTFEQAYIAEIQSPQFVEIRARVQGVIEKIYVDEGQEVTTGQRLFSLNSAMLQTALKRAEALLNSTLAEARMVEVELQNTSALVKQNIVAPTELELARAKYESISAKAEEVRAQIAESKLQIALTEIRAPFAGIINRIPNKVGSLVEENMLLTTLSSNHDVFAYFNVSEKEYMEISRRKDWMRKGGVRLQLVTGEQHPHAGMIETAETVINKETGSIAFRARFPNPGHILKHGASAKVLIPLKLENAMLIPQRSTFEVQDKTCVFVIDASGHVSTRVIVPKLRMGQLYVVESGLRPDEQLVYEGLQKVREGDRVQGVFIPMQQIMPLLAAR